MSINKLNGAKFTPRSFRRATIMSIAMAEAGIIPAPHIIMDKVCTATVRNRNDNRNQRKSVTVAF